MKYFKILMLAVCTIAALAAFADENREVHAKVFFVSAASYLVAEGIGLASQILL